MIIAQIYANNLGRINSRIERINDLTNEGDLRPVLRGDNLVEQEHLLPELPEEYFLENDLDTKLHNIKTRRSRRELGFRIPPSDENPKAQYIDHRFMEQYHQGTGVKITEEDYVTFGSIIPVVFSG